MENSAIVTPTRRNTRKKLGLRRVIQRLHELGAEDVKVCVLLQKKKGQIPVQVDWIGFKIPDRFVVGYGLDYDGRFRGLKQIRVLETQAV